LERIIYPRFEEIETVSHLLYEFKRAFGDWLHELEARCHEVSVKLHSPSTGRVIDGNQELKELNEDPLHAVVVAELHNRPVPDDGAVLPHAYPYVFTALNNSFRIIVREDGTKTLANLKERLHEILLIAGVGGSEISFYQRSRLLPLETTMAEVSLKVCIEIRNVD
jgi:hypothetical protein